MTNVADLFALAAQHHAAGNLQQAERVLQQFVQAHPQHADAHHILGIVAYQTGKHEQAFLSIGEAIRLAPRTSTFHCNLGLVSAALGRDDEAAASFQQALQLKPDLAEAWNNLGNVHFKTNKYLEAVHCFREAVRLTPTYAEAYFNLGQAHKRLARLDEAVASYQQAIELRPNFIAALTNLGSLLAQQGELERGLACLERALRLNPNLGLPHCNRALVWLTTGDFERGWPEYEWRWSQPGVVKREYAQPRWDGSELHGKTILLHAEQGLGDTLQFMRYAALVKQRGGRVILECQTPLVRLLENAPGVDAVLAEGSPLPPCDVRAPLLSLPLIFRTALDTIPGTVPYLHADASLVEQWRQTIGPSKRDGGRCLQVGIAWQGSPTFRCDSQRSIALKHFASLAQLEGVKLISLQKGPGTEQLQALAGQFPVVDLGEDFDTANGPFVDTAAIMSNVDLVISSDSALGHLAGALGASVWLALPFVADWRWLLEREDSPWYPSMRLFRQRQHGEWDGVFCRIREALKAHLDTFGSVFP